MSIDKDINEIITTIDDHISKITKIIGKKKICLKELNDLNKKIEEIELLNNNEEISQIKKKLEDKEKSLNYKIQLLEEKKKEFETLQENKEVKKTIFSTTLATSQEEKKEEIKKKLKIIEYIIRLNRYTEFGNIIPKTEEILKKINTINLEKLEKIVKEEIEEIYKLASEENFKCNSIEEEIYKNIEDLNNKIDERNALFYEINKDRENFMVFRKRSYNDAKKISKETFNIANNIYTELYNKYNNCKILDNIKQIFEEILELCH